MSKKISKTLYRYVAFLLAFTLCMQVLAGCGSSNSNQSGFTTINEQHINEEHINEEILSEEKIDESYIAENIIAEDLIYEYTIDENTIAESYIIECTISDNIEKKIEEQLPEEAELYQIDWRSVIGKFAIGTSVVLVVAIANVATKGKTIAVFGTAKSVLTTAVASGTGIDDVSDILKAKSKTGRVIGIALASASIASLLATLKNAGDSGELESKAVAKYAIEGFADGYMWGAIGAITFSALDDLIKSLRPSKLKFATGIVGKIDDAGKVIDESGNVIGDAYTIGKKTMFIDGETNTLVTFDKKGNQIANDIDMLQGLEGALPPDRKLITGAKDATKIVETDDTGTIFKTITRAADGSDVIELIKNGSYTINGYKYTTDSIGRIIKVEFKEMKLKPEGTFRKKIANTISEIGHGFERNGDDRGHLIADRFLGDNSAANIVAMDGEVNKGTYKKIEDAIADEILKGNKVSGSITITYPDSNSFRPESFEYVYNAGAGDVVTNILN
ncbi:DNA/RNA non-specific endonuclease [Butyrivibrio fibrisolvens]|uniref:DNA/RNA non-specific endonuclease n=1 Tax=Butyrivibrio fibrisolvens TaxID=831 RepID=UPI0003FE45BB|nr:DNA/RNA non-specific endonuclease [Butyrivibrio fibrisolvens]